MTVNWQDQGQCSSCEEAVTLQRNVAPRDAGIVQKECPPGREALAWQTLMLECARRHHTPQPGSDRLETRSALVLGFHLANERVFAQQRTLSSGVFESRACRDPVIS